MFTVTTISCIICTLSVLLLIIKRTCISNTLLSTMELHDIVYIDYSIHITNYSPYMIAKNCSSVRLLKYSTSSLTNSQSLAILSTPHASEERLHDTNSYACAGHTNDTSAFHNNNNYYACAFHCQPAKTSKSSNAIGATRRRIREGKFSPP